MRALSVQLAAAVALPLTILVAVGIWSAYSEQRRQQEAALIGRAQALAASVDREFESAETVLRMLGNSSALAQGDLDGFDAEMRRAQASLGGPLINLTAPTGEVTLTTFWPPGFRKQGVRASSFLLGAMQARRAAVSDIVIGPQSHLPEVGVAVPVPGRVGQSGAADSLPWMLSLYLSTERIDGLLAAMHLPEGWLAAITDSQVRVFARTRDLALFMGKQPPPDILAQERRLDSGIVGGAHKSMDGVPMLSAFARAPITRYVVAIGIPLADFSGPLGNRLFRTAGVALLLTGLGVAGALLFARRIDRALRAVGAAPVEAPVRTGLLEIDELSRTIASAEAQRRKAEAALRESESNQRELLATIDLAPIFVTDPRGRILFWSHGCERLYGWSAAEAVGRAATDLLGAMPPVKSAERDGHLAEHGEWEGDVVQHRRDGTALTVSLRAVLRPGSGEREPLILQTGADVTALRVVEGELRALNQHLEARVRAEVTAREETAARAAHGERMRALGQLAGGIAHDVNNVLQSITSYADMIEMSGGEDPAEIRVHAEHIVLAAERGAAVTRRLLMFARQTELKTEKVEAGPLLEQMREMLQPTLGRRIAIKVSVARGLPAVLADRSQLETVLVNLVTNGRDAIPERATGTLTFLARLETVVETSGTPVPRPGKYVVLSVSDDGAGMNAETLARAIEPFFSTKAPGKGTGLGLATAREFAQQSHGGLAIESAVGVGTVVSLWLPTADMAEAGAAISVRRVLLVEDDLDLIEKLAAGLAQKGYAVSTATSCEGALAAYGEGGRFECLVTDLSLPDRDGLALIREVRELDPKIPAILLTGYINHRALQRDDGVEPYTLLVKPTDSTRIARRISELLSGSQAFAVT